MKWILFIYLIGGVAQAQYRNNNVPESQYDMDSLTPADRARYYQYLSSKKHCTTMQGTVDKTCGTIDDIHSGDDTFKDPYYLKNIPKPTSVRVLTRCDESEGKFYTTVYYKDKNGVFKNFKNPLGIASNQVKRTANGTNVERWLTSPGIYNYVPEIHQEGDHPVGRWRTSIPPVNNGEGYITQWHKVSKNKAWEGADMPWTVWVNGDIAYHGSDPRNKKQKAEGEPNPNVTGYPESHGCFRLETGNAMALFNLMRRAGTGAVSFHWGGYGAINPSTGQPYCAGKYGPDGKLLNDNRRVLAREGTVKQIRSKSANSLGNLFRKVGNFFGFKRKGAKPIRSQRSSD